MDEDKRKTIADYDRGYGYTYRDETPEDVAKADPAGADYMDPAGTNAGRLSGDTAPLNTDHGDKLTYGEGFTFRDSEPEDHPEQADSGFYSPTTGNDSGAGRYDETQYGESPYRGETYSGQTYSGQTYNDQQNAYYSETAPETETAGGGGGWEPPAGGRAEKYRKRGFGRRGNNGGRRAAAVPMQITKRGFILSLILAMIITSAATFGGVAYLYNLQGNDNNATNYSLTSASKTQLSYKSIIQKNKNSVVSITTQSVSTDRWMQNYVTEGAGSGIIIQSDGYILTCNHVIEDATKITVTLANEKQYTAEVVGADSQNDVAVLKIKAKNLDAVTYGDSDSLEVGDTAVAIGNPLGELGGTATTGIISATNRNLTIDGKQMNLLQTDAAINPGNSGGALFDGAGNLIGVVVAKTASSDVEGLGFAIPVNQAAKLAKEMIENEGSYQPKTNTQNGSVSGNDAENSDTPKIGVTVLTMSDDEAKENGLQAGGGIYIASVTSQSAQQAGLQAGDKIVALNGEDVSSFSELSSILQKCKKGQKVKVQINRNGDKKTVTVTLS